MSLKHMLAFSELFINHIYNMLSFTVAMSV